MLASLPGASVDRRRARAIFFFFFSFLRSARGPNTLTVELSHLPTGASVAAVRYAAGSGGYNISSGRYSMIYAVRGSWAWAEGSSAIHPGTPWSTRVNFTLCQLGWRFQTLSESDSASVHV